VTIFGESSGGTSVGYHLLSERSYGASGSASRSPLFARAILQSPGLTQTKRFDHADVNLRYVLGGLATAAQPKAKPLKECVVTPGYWLVVHANTQSSDPKLNSKMTLADAKASCLNNSKCVGFSVPINSTTAQGANATVPVLFSTVYFSGHPGYDRLHNNTERVAFWRGMALDNQREIDQAMKCLVAAPTDSLVQAGLHVPYSDTFATDQWSPVVDGTTCACRQLECAYRQLECCSRAICAICAICASCASCAHASSAHAFRLAFCSLLLALQASSSCSH
jgi:hypothetical protein